ncbi:hypothetical protein C1646_773461, partial [Rhizophagus diaphanus]
MSSELELLKQRITELEAKNSSFRIKLSVSDAEIAKLKHRNAEFLRVNKEYNNAEIAKLRAKNVEFRDRLTKVEQNQSLNDNFSNNSLPSFNSVADQVPTVTHHKKLLVNTSLSEDKKTDAFLDEEYKKKSLPTHPEEKMSQDLNSVTQPCNSTSSEEKICSELDS